MISSRSVIRTVSLAAVLAMVLYAAPSAVAAEPATESQHLKSLPADTFVLVHLKDVPKTLDEIRGSAPFKTLEAFLNSSMFERTKAQNEKAAVLSELALSLPVEIQKALVGEATFALTGFNPDQRRPDLVFMARAEEDKFTTLIKDVIAPTIKKLGGNEIVIGESGELRTLAPKDGRGKLLFMFDRNNLILSPFEDSFETVMSVTEPLSESSLLKSTFKTHKASPDALCYINLQRFMQNVGVREEYIPEAIRLTGITSIAGIGASANHLSTGGTGEITAYAPNGLRGILSLLANRGSGPSVEKLIPSDYSAVMKLSVDSFEGLYRDIIALMEKELSEEEFVIDEFTEMIEDIGDKLGFSVEEDLLPNLGGEIAVAAKAPRVIGIPEMAAFLQVKDKEKISTIIEKVKSSAMPGLQFTSSTYKGVEINSIAVMLVQPCYAFVGDYLVVADGPAVMRDIIDALVSGESILTKDDYRTVFSNMPGKSVLSIYVDTKQVFDPLVPLIASKGREKWLSFILSDFQMRMQQLPGMGLTVSADDNNVHIRGFSGIDVPESVVLFAGFAMFHVRSARHDAGNVASMSNMKQILIASRMYALDNDEKYPGSLGALYPNYVSSYDVFQHPHYKHKGIAEDEEIDDLASYVLVKGVDETRPADTILLYEKDLFVEEGWRNVGFVDGHVEQMSEEVFQRKLKEQQKREED